MKITINTTPFWGAWKVLGWEKAEGKVAGYGIDVEKIKKCIANKEKLLIENRDIIYEVNYRKLKKIMKMPYSYIIGGKMLKVFPINRRWLKKVEDNRDLRGRLIGYKVREKVSQQLSLV